jgi:predicted amidohydrolase
MTSRNVKADNIEKAERLVACAAATGADVVVLPEKWNLIGSVEDLQANAEPLAGGDSVDAMARWAREHGVTIVGGSITEFREGREKLSNTSLVFDPEGSLAAVYRKIHLFDVTVGDVDYRESASGEAGDSAATATAADGTKLGLTVCYDVRFPELYRILALEGALVLTVPANFTRTTGAAHWELLLRARAVENQAFVVAPAQAGEYPPGQPAYGNSMIVDPWGEVLARAPGGDEECFVAADLDFARLAEIRAKLPSLQNRVPGAYRWPVEVHA